MDNVTRRTRDWLERSVVGLDLCPFAKGPLAGGRVRIAVSEAEGLEGALSDLWIELDRLFAAPEAELETTVLVLPHLFSDFNDFHEAASLVELVLDRAGYAEVAQVVSFHPRYVFGDAVADDPANYTNRSPYPAWHLLRQASISRAVQSHPDIAEVPRRNVRLLRSFDANTLRGWMLETAPVQ